ncbi:MAG: T9SS type A sorting domain-containing protein, partial [FCB group bacterium]|nr:T9SS type A sorting domain-containing protein [FCB group bacterium]
NSSRLQVVNSLLWNNEGGEVYFADFDDSSTILLAYTDITSGIDGITTNDNGEIIWSDGNLNQDPGFADTLNSNYALTLNSPAVDAGTAWFVYHGDTLVNLMEEDYQGAAPDMGALEFTPDTVHYFPLSNQQTWIYVSDEDSFSVSVVDSLMINGMNYFQLDQWYPGENITLFRNTGNQVYVRSDTNEFMLYDFAASVGENWTVPGPDGSPVTVTFTGLDAIVETPSGTYESCDVFERFIGADYAYTEWFAPEIGLVQRDVITFAGTRRYQLVYTGPVLSSDERNTRLAEVYRLDGNYPNPFNPSTMIRYDLPTAGTVNLSVFDLRGRLVRSLIDRYQEAGKYSVRWNGKNQNDQSVSSGLYIVRMEADGNIRTHTMVLLR